MFFFVNFSLAMDKDSGRPLTLYKNVMPKRNSLFQLNFPMRKTNKVLYLKDSRLDGDECIVTNWPLIPFYFVFIQEYFKCLTRLMNFKS